jgi:hypothetical protein
VNTYFSRPTRFNTCQQKRSPDQGSARQSEPSPQWRENLVANNREHHFSSDDISEPPAKPKPKRRAKQKVTKPVTPLPPDTLAGLASGRDRIVLGAALDDPPPPTAGALFHRLMT